MNNEPIICLYHKQCVDGTTAAAVVLRAYPHAQTFPIAFDTADQDLAPAFEVYTTNARVIFVDITIGLEKFLERGGKILVIDHHISEQDRVAALAEKNPQLQSVFKVTESGASLAWQYFFPTESLPPCVAYVRDIDLYTNALLPESEWCATYLSQYRDKPEQVVSLFSEDLSKVLSLGQALTEYIDGEIEKMCKLQPVFLETEVGTVPAYNITNYQSKAGNYLSLKMASAVILYKISGDTVRCSVRSCAGQTPSALAVAATFGGGGHEFSAGAGVARNHFFSLIKKESTL